jgi:hypothetical protein
MSDMVIAVLAMALIAVPLMAYTVAMLMRQRRPRAWRPVPGKVVRSWLAETVLPGSENVPAWYVRVLYDYPWEGGTRTASTLNADPHAFRFVSRRRALRCLARWPAGAEVPVYVSHRGEAVLTRRVEWHRMSHYLATGLGGLVALGLTVFLYIALR